MKNIKNNKEKITSLVFIISTRRMKDEISLKFYFQLLQINNKKKCITVENRFI